MDLIEEIKERKKRRVRKNPALTNYMYPALTNLVKKNESR